MLKSQGHTSSILSRFVYFSIMLLMLMDYMFFYLVEIPSYFKPIWSIYDKSLLVLIAIVITIFVLLNVKFTNSKILSQYPFIFRYLFALSASIFILCCISFFLYPAMSVQNMVREVAHFFLLILTIPICWYFSVQRGYFKLLNGFNRLQFIWYILVLLQHFNYHGSAHMFLDVEKHIRNGGLRIGLNSLGSFLILYNFDVVYCKRKYENRLFAMLQLLLSTFELIFIQQTRAAMIAVFLALGFIAIANSNTIKKTIMNVIFILGVVLYLINSGVLDSLITSFSPTNKTFGAGTEARILATNYYWNAFVSNPLYGQGIASSAIYPKVEHGLRGIYYYSDVGGVAIFARYGLFVIPMYFWPVVYLGIITWKIAKSKIFRRDYGLLLGAFVYFIMTMQTLIITDSERIFLYPLIISMFCYVDSLIKRPNIIGAATHGNLTYSP